MTLDRVPIGTSARVLVVEGSGRLALRLMEMGMVPGALIRVVKDAPLGDPLHICVRDYHLALRRAEAETVTVQLTAP